MKRPDLQVHPGPEVELPGPVRPLGAEQRLPSGDSARRRLRRVFLEGFRASDIAAPLVSFDWDRPSSAVRKPMASRGYDWVGVRRDGIVHGYAARSDLVQGACGAHERAFGPDDLIADDASLQDVIVSLGRNGRCFLTHLGHVSAIVTHDDLEKPPVRMFLFGMITLLEMLFVRTVEAAFSEDEWTAMVSPVRLEKARELKAERERRGHSGRLIDCLQFSDKGQVALRIGDVARSLDPKLSRKEVKRALKELETLRNDLAHGQAFVSTSWERIVQFATRLDDLLESI